MQQTLLEAANEGVCHVVCQARVCDSLILTLGHCFSDSRFSQTSFVIVSMLKPVLTVPNGDINDSCVHLSQFLYYLGFYFDRCSRFMKRLATARSWRRNGH